MIDIQAEYWWLATTFEEVYDLVSKVYKDVKSKQSNRKLEREMLLLMGRSNALKTEIAKEIIRQEDIKVRKNQIADTLTDILKQYEMSVTSYFEVDQQ